jgi:hypothetical protein
MNFDDPWVQLGILAGIILSIPLMLDVLAALIDRLRR